MLTYPNISPEIVKLGPIELRWYGLMYVVGFILCYFILKSEIKRKKLGYSNDDLYDYIFYLILGTILGGRLGYILFYNLPHYLANPMEMLMINKGGMSFHGGLIGVILATWFFSKKLKKPFYELADMGALAGSIGLGFGRIGNFINGELFGRVTDPSFPLSMVFPLGGPDPRHPSQLYESFFEGFLMFAILYFLSRKNLKQGTLIWSFVMLYGFFRFFIEYTREADVQMGLFFGAFSMGQLLCLPMFLFGLGMIIYVSIKGKPQSIPVNAEVIVDNSVENNNP